MNVNRVNTHMVKPFAYHLPETVKEAIRILEENRGSVPLAGGTDLIPKMKQGLVEPEHLVNLKKIPELRGIRERGEGVEIGAVTRLREIERCSLIRVRLPLLHSAVCAIGSVQIRNMGTIGGNVCNASPAADGAAALVALNSKAAINGLEGERSMALQDLFMGPGVTALRDGEILTKIYVPFPGPGTGTCFRNVRRTSLDISTLSVAASLTMRGGEVDGCRLVAGAVAPAPMRLVTVESYLEGRQLSREAVSGASEMASRVIRPISDIRATADFRRAAIRGLVAEALTEAAEAAGREQR